MFFEPAYAINRGYYYRDVIRAFEQIGYQYKFTSARKYHGNFPYGTIVYVRSDDIPAGHYLARVDSGWVDSWINMLEPGNLNVKVGIRKSLPAALSGLFTKSDIIRLAIVALGRFLKRARWRHVQLGSSIMNI